MDKFRELLSDVKNMSLFFDSLPYMVGVYEKSGKPIYVNQAFINTLNITDKNKFMDTYNVFECSQTAPEIASFLKKLFLGKPATYDSLRTPTLGTSKHEFLRQVMTGSPLFDELDNITHVIVVSYASVIYKGKSEVVKVLEYLSENWFHDFDINKIEEVANLSSRQISRVFKEELGKTPFAYYQQLKIDKIKEALDNPDLNVEQAFKSCGVEYSGMYAKYFKSVVGISPLEYKKGKTMPL